MAVSTFYLGDDGISVFERTPSGRVSLFAMGNHETAPLIAHVMTERALTFPSEHVRREAIATGFLIEYDGAVLRGRPGSTKYNPLYWQTRKAAERALAQATSLHDRKPRVVEVLLIQVP